MTNLLVFKEQIREIYIRYGNVIRLVGKFLAAFLAFMIINDKLGFDQKLSQPPVALLLACVCAVLPYGAITIFAAVLTIGQVFMVSPLIAAVIFVVYLIMYCLAVRYTKKLVNVILAVPILCILKIPYVVPILMGLIATPAAALPTACGVMVYYFFCAVKNITTATMGTGMEENLSLYKQLMDNLLANHEMLFMVLLFVIVLFLTYFIRRRDMDYAFETANGVGMVVCILGILLGKLVFDMQVDILSSLTGSVVSGVLVFLVWHVRMSLDYSATEYLQFEDDDYYYYVKAVPKMKITAPEKNVKRINPQKNNPEGNTQMNDADRFDM